MGPKSMNFIRGNVYLSIINIDFFYLDLFKRVMNVRDKYKSSAQYLQNHHNSRNLQLR